MVNKVILIGNVGMDPEIRTFEDGNKVARIRLATTERTFNPATQERSERTEWHTVTAWRGLAGIAEQYVRKGTQLYIEGKLRTREWQDNTGAKRYSVEIVADNMNMLGRRQEGATTGAPYTPPAASAQPAYGGRQPAAAPQARPAAASYDPAPFEGGAMDGGDDDLPF